MKRRITQWFNDAMAPVHDKKKIRIVRRLIQYLLNEELPRFKLDFFEYLKSGNVLERIVKRLMVKFQLNFRVGDLSQVMHDPFDVFIQFCAYRGVHCPYSKFDMIDTPYYVVELIDALRMNIEREFGPFDIYAGIDDMNAVGKYGGQQSVMREDVVKNRDDVAKREHPQSAPFLFVLLLVIVWLYLVLDIGSLI
eukprot:TRINITY_DN6724_c0_g1_i2.p2 TRINITY_DN6724_c0_g1~~TRINITY_DN6724_c0_g1_i2.p2  ORF type:complete len:194 (+),score=41.26 TRINITY_DN6724_c0_g1_i2:904-1485(+)